MPTMQMPSIQTPLPLSGMAVSAAESSAFVREVALHQTIWTLAGPEGCPTLERAGGRMAVPMWSSLDRAESAQASCPEFSGCVPRRIPWMTFVGEWADEVCNRRLTIGLNWHGPTAAGYDRDIADVIAAIEREMLG